MLPDGSRVILRGLQYESEHNGKEGVISSFEPHACRYLVRFGAGSILSIRPRNLLQSLVIQIVDLESRPTLNGLFGRIVGDDEYRLRYHVRMQDGQVISVATMNVILPMGTQARVVNLQNDQHWNGHVGCITSVDRNAKRYVVAMSADKYLKVRLESMLL